MPINVRVVNEKINIKTHKDSEVVDSVSTWTRTAQQKWEYMDLIYKHKFDEDSKQYPDQKLSSLGDNGWELVSVTKVDEGNTREGVWLAWFKRPKVRTSYDQPLI